MNILHYIPSGWDNFTACVWMWSIWAIYVLGPAFSSLFWHLSAICIALKPNAMGTKFCQNGDPFFLVKSGPNGNLRQQNRDPISKIEGNKPIRWNRGETSYLQSGPKNWKRSPWEPTWLQWHWDWLYFFVQHQPSHLLLIHIVRCLSLWFTSESCSSPTIHPTSGICSSHRRILVILHADFH